MSILLVLFISFSTIIVSKWIFQKWFNHLFAYTFVWTFFLVLYELKLIRYIEISSETFFIFFICHIGVISGALTVYYAREIYRTDRRIVKIPLHSILFEGELKPIKLIILLTSLFGFYSAFENWIILFNKFGSITEILIKANLIYRLRVSGELESGIPYISVLPYAGIVLSGIYTAAKNRISIFTLLPLLSIIIKDTASVGRGGIFVGFSMLFTSFFLFRFAVTDNKIIKNVSSNKSLIVGSILLLTVVFTSLILVMEFRGRFDDFKGKTNFFDQFEGVPLLNPSTYYYFSSNVGVFSKYFELQIENPNIGENTFLPIYNLISKFGIIEHPGFYPQGYSIPTWSNSATYLREIHADFGNLGLFFIPYFLSLLTAYFWFRFYEKGDLISFVNLTYLFVINLFSIFNMLTRAAFFLLSFLFLIFLIQFLEKFWKKNQI